MSEESGAVFTGYHRVGGQNSRETKHKSIFLVLGGKPQKGMPNMNKACMHLRNGKEMLHYADQGHSSLTHSLTSLSLLLCSPLSTEIPTICTPSPSAHSSLAAGHEADSIP
jgi:hypothetical protein